MSLTPSERSLRARVAAHAVHARGGTSTAAGTAAFLSRFEREVDPDNTLTPAERAKRADHARKSYMTSLALKASRSRSRKKNTTDVSETSSVVSVEVRRAADTAS